MIDLGHGRIYVNQNEPLPFSCPVCSAPVPYKTRKVAQFLICPACGHSDSRDAFETSQWRMAEVN